MWGKDDENRKLLKDLSAALREPDATVAEWKLLAATTGAMAAGSVNEMIYKEEQILFPICLERFTADEWAEIWASSPRYGLCLVEPREGYTPVDLHAAGTSATPDGVSLPTGNLAVEQLIGIFSTLPVDLTFVDADDRVAFFSEGPNRVFARSRAIVGRKVQNCHPPRSVDVVERILSDFREGRQNVAEFWIQLPGRFVHIRYFAVRSADAATSARWRSHRTSTRSVGSRVERRLLYFDLPVAEIARELGDRP